MDDVSLFRQDHASHTHPGVPEVVRRPKFPETEQAEDKHH